MNIFQFLFLICNIFGKKPNIEAIQKQWLLAIKIAQVFAVRIDFLSKESCIELSKLFSQNFHEHDASFDELTRSMASADWQSQFRSIEKTPIASASIGQVHRARLHSGELVAIKLVKKDFSRSFLHDIEQVKKFLKWSIRFYPKLEKVANPLAVLESIQTTTISELNLLHEIDNAEILRETVQQYSGFIDTSIFAIPKYFRELSSSNILVSEYIEWDHFDTLLEQGKMPYELLMSFFRIHGSCMFGAGVFHGDVHPGNLILRDWKIYFIDNGALSYVLTSTRIWLFHFFERLVEYDYYGCANALIDMSLTQIADTKKFYEQFEQLYRDFRWKTVTEVSLTEQMMNTIKLAVYHGATFHDDMFPIIKSLMYLDGMVIQCNPHANLIQDLKPFIQEFKTII